MDLCELPPIFTNIPAEEYALLSPLAAKTFIEEERRRIAFLLPEKYGNASDEEWRAYFAKPRGYVKGEHNDFDILFPLSEMTESGEWKKSKLTAVKDYICALL